MAVDDTSAAMTVECTLCIMASAAAQPMVKGCALGFLARHPRLTAQSRRRWLLAGLGHGGRPALAGRSDYVALRVATARLPVAVGVNVTRLAGGDEACVARRPAVLYEDGYEGEGEGEGEVEAAFEGARVATSAPTARGGAFPGCHASSSCRSA